MKKILAVLVVLFMLVGINNAQSKVSVGGNATLAIPVGSFGDGVGTGIGVIGSFQYMLQKNLAITGNLGYISFGEKDFGGIKSSMSDVPLLVGIRYFLNASSVMPYLAAELGLHFTSMEVTIPTIDLGGFGTYGGGSASASSSDFGFGFGGGFLYPLNKKLNLDVNAQYNIITTSGSSSGYIGIEAGVLFGLN